MPEDRRAEDRFNADGEVTLSFDDPAPRCLAGRLLDDWELALNRLVKVMPTELRKVLDLRAAQRLELVG